MVLFITDGHPTVGETDEPAIAANAKKANKGSRIFTFGVGDDLNARLLDRMAEDGAGRERLRARRQGLRGEDRRLLRQGGEPGARRLALDLSAFGAYDVYPRRLGDLFKGSQLVVMGRYRTPKEGTVVLTRLVQREAEGLRVPRPRPPAQAKGFDFVPRLWAIRKVGYLLEEIRLHGEQPELKEEIVGAGQEVRHRHAVHLVPGGRGHAGREADASVDAAVSITLGRAPGNAASHGQGLWRRLHSEPGDRRRPPRTRLRRWRPNLLRSATRSARRRGRVASPRRRRCER